MIEATKRREVDAMERTDGDARYGAWLIRLHWLTLLLLVAVYASIELRELYPRGSDMRNLLKEWHYGLGLATFALVWIRLAVRAAGWSPAIVPAPPVWQSRAAAATHAALYVFMAAMPLLGWLSLGAAGKPPSFLGIALPGLVAPSPTLEKGFEEIHEALGVAGYWLVALHAAAGLVHHYVLRDNTLRRMLPRWSRPRAG
jgi:cytochrome b561